MARQTFLEKLKRETPSWAMSFVIHVILLFAFAMITWVVITDETKDKVLTLAEPVLLNEGSLDATGSSGSNSSARRKKASSVPRAPKTLPMPVIPQMNVLSKGLAPPENPDLSNVIIASGNFDPAAHTTESLTSAFSGERGPAGGPGRGNGTGAFGDHLEILKRQGLDVILVLDATDSMTPYIGQAKKRLHDIINVVTKIIPNSRFGAVAYKDYGDDYGMTAVKFQKLDKESADIKKFIDGIASGGGGDEPEPIHQALKAATDIEKMGIVPRRKTVIILVGDSPVHSTGVQQAYAMAKKFHDKINGTINVIDVGGDTKGKKRQSVQPHLAGIASDGGGYAFLLKDREKFWKHLIISIFGRKYSEDVNKIIEQSTDKE